MATALESRGDVELTLYDGTYSSVYARQQDPNRVYDGFFPIDIGTYQVVHIIWNALTMNHYAGAHWQLLQQAGIVTSWWDGGPSDASCPFESVMQVKWSDYPRPGYHYMYYPAVDWIDDLPDPDAAFTLGASSVRGDGVAAVREIAERYGWHMNLPVAGQWLSPEDEIRRLARSTVNVCWYHTPPLWKNRASAPSMLLSARRPMLVNDDPLLEHLKDYGEDQGVYHGYKDTHNGPGLEQSLLYLQKLWRHNGLKCPTRPWFDLRWSKSLRTFMDVWTDAIATVSRA